MGFRDFLDNIFKRPAVNISTGETAEYEEMRTAAVTTFAIFSVIEIIASICSKAEFKVYRNGEGFKAHEWYSLNVRPNVNQSSSEFWKEAVANLLFCGELLIIPSGEQKIIAENFCVEKFALRENIFTQVYRKGFTFNRSFKASEVFYVRYANEDVRSLLNGIFVTYGKLFNEAANKYMISGGQKGALEIPAAAVGMKDFEKTYQDLMNNRFKSFYKAKNAVLPLWNGMKYVPANAPASAKAANEITDIKNLFDEAITRAAQAYKFPPQLVRGEVSGINDAVDYMLTICIDPLLFTISEELSGKEFTPEEYLRGNYIDADTTNIKHFDIFSNAADVEKTIGSALVSINETRERAGLPKINEPWADKHFYTKNFDTVDNMTAAEGGETE